jgi:hypothetical protein
MGFIKGILILFLLLCIYIVFDCAIESKDRTRFISSIIVGAIFILNIIVLMFV